MKSAFFVYGTFVLLTGVASAQNPVSDARKRMTERRNTGNTGAVVTPAPPQTRTVISYVTYLSKEREWADVSGRKMTGRLVAFSAPEPGKTGPVVVLQDGKVRLRRAGAKVSNDLPLDKLSQADQLFVKGIESAIKRSAEQAPKKPE
jgi:hypothetical protein